jgi:hypothetical protein
LNILQAAPVDKSFQILGVELRKIGDVERLIRQAEADMVGRDTAKPSTQALDQVPIHERPGRIAMNEQDHPDPSST